MAVTLKNLSKNLTIIMGEILRVQDACKLILYDVKDPYDAEDIADTSILIDDRILPRPFDLEDGSGDRSELRVWYPDGQLKGNQVIGNIQVYFDIVVAKDLWTISSDDWSSIRPYDIAHHITNHFQANPINGIGKLHFDQGFRHLGTNTKFDIIRLIATMMVGN